MKRKNWTSLFVVLTMVLSMATIILLPTGAEEIDYDALPLASTAYWDDKISAYKIDSVGELIKVNMAVKQSRDGSKLFSGDGGYANDNFEPDDVIYLTADLDMADWDWQEFASYDEETGLYTPNKIAYADNSSDCNYLYANNDGSAKEIVTCADQKELFASMYTGLVLGYRTGRGYGISRFTFDGLGHTIYNYTANNAFFNGNYVGIIQNLTFDGAYVTAGENVNSGGTIYRPGAGIVTRGSACRNQAGWTKTEYALTMDNVHIYNSVSDYGEYPDTEAGLFFVSHNKNGSNSEEVKFVNCSAGNSHIIAPNATAASSYGLITGRTSAPTVIDNVILYGCSITTGGGDYRGLMIGSGADDTKGWAVSNVAVVDCSYISGGVTAENVAIVGNFNKITTASSFDNFYLSGNTFATEAGGAETAMTNALIFPGEVANYARATVGKFVTDANVENITYWTKDTAQNTAVTDKTLESDLPTIAATMNENLGEGSLFWALRKDGNPVATDNVDNLPHTITFILNDETTLSFKTDYEQAVIADPESMVILSLNEWDAAEGKNVQAGSDWGTVQNPKDNTYTLVPHEVTYTDHGDGTHTAYCITCDSDVHNGTYSCTETAPVGVFIDGNYYNEAVHEYTCLACGHIWQEIDDAATELLLSPFAVELEKDLYSNIDETVDVSFTAPADANLVAFTAIVTFNTDVMTYTGCDPADPAYACIVNDAEAADGKLVVSVSSLDGTVLTDAEAVLHFTFDAYAGTEEIIDSVDVSAELISALVYSEEDGTAERINDVVKKNDSDEAPVIYVETNVLPGDVDNSGVVELLDAVILIEKLSGQIHESQDGNAFFILASDVDDNGVTDRVDADLIIDHIADQGMTELVLATKLPTVLYD